MIDCKICFRSFNALNALSSHISDEHRDFSKEKYFCEFIGNIEDSLCECGQSKKFFGFSKKYRKYCSPKCELKFKKKTQYWLGKKQSKETILKRIQNTNQTKKQEKNKATIIAKYGVGNITQTDKIRETISIKLKGKSSPRKNQHQENLIASKKRNNTTNHSKETRQKISDSLKTLYQSDDYFVPLPNHATKKYKSGVYGGFFYRSSYELTFISYCVQHDIDIVSAETKDFRVPYFKNGKRHWYYPDFYLKKYDTIIEIKPNSMLLIDEVMDKLDAGARHHQNYLILDEEKLMNLDELFSNIENWI